MAKKKTFYVTTSIAYTNREPHLGFALELIQADVLARYHRLLEEEVFFSTGTDEHGLKVMKAAQKAGKEPKQFCNQISREFKKLTKVLNCSNDVFIRTTDKKKHWPAVEKLWRSLEEKGDLYKKKYKGLYCPDCEAFLTKKELKEGKCPVHKKKPKKIEEENYFFKLSRYQNQLKKAIKKDKMKVIPETRKNEILSLIKEGLRDVSFSRLRKNLEWGIPVPDDEQQTIYCWADALTNYLSGLGFGRKEEKFKKFWPADVQCIGKDILKFHAAIWPAMLLSLELKLPKTILVHGFITVNGEKMSKSLGNVIDPFELVNKYGADPVRYFLLREISPFKDGDFTNKKFKDRYNSDLASGLGNLISRVLTIAQKVEVKKAKPKDLEKEIKKAKKDYEKALNKFEFNQALIAIWRLIKKCDKYVEEKEPWSLRKGKELNKVLNNLLLALGEINTLLKPFLPETSKKISKQLGIKEKPWDFSPTKARKPLFPRIK